MMAMSHRNLFVLLVIAATSVPAGAQWTTRPRPGNPPVVCSTGTVPCNGPFGQTCYAPARGERCTQGLVCNLGTQPCVGPYGGGCYAPAQGQACNQGLVCGIGQQVCARGGYAQCYSPARGETCG